MSDTIDHLTMKNVTPVIERQDQLLKEAQGKKTKTQPRNEKIFNAYSLDPVDDEILKIIVKHPGISQRELAALSSMSRTQLRSRMSKPAFKDRYSSMTESATSLLLKAQTMAVRRMMQLIHSKDENIAYHASRTVLAPLVNYAKIEVEETKRMVYQTQFGSEGRIYQTITAENEDETKKQLPSILDLLNQ